MSSLWTPGGEVPISRSGGGSTSGGGGPEGGSPAPSAARPAVQSPDDAPPEVSDEEMSAMLGGVNLDDLSPEEREEAERIMAEMAETQRRLAGMPAADVVANHAMGLYELAAIHLSQPTPQLADASVAIDALAALVGAVGDRFGENLPVLRNALSNLQSAYVQIKDASVGDGAG